MNVSPIVHQNLSDKIYDLLKESIVRWEFRPGQRLIDAEIAQHFGVSRSLVRNAITLLANEGLVEISRRRFYVARFAQKDIHDILQLRHMLEMSALKTAIANTTDDEIADLDAKMNAVRERVAKGDLERFYAIDVETHQMIIDKGNNDYIKKVYSNLQTLLRMVIRSDFGKQYKISESYAEHTRIIDAWKRHDFAAVANALDDHLTRAEERVMENFAKILNDASQDEASADAQSVISLKGNP